MHYPRWRALTYVIHSWPAGQIHADSGTRLGSKPCKFYSCSTAVYVYDGRSGTVVSSLQLAGTRPVRSEGLQYWRHYALQLAAEYSSPPCCSWRSLTTPALPRRAVRGKQLLARLLQGMQLHASKLAKRAYARVSVLHSGGKIQ